MTFTSENNPLRVAWLGDTPALGLTIAPGKVGTMLGKTHRRDLNADLKAVKAQGVDVLVNLMEQGEMGEWHMQDYFSEAQAAGLEVIHFPIRDMDVPTDMAAVRQLVAALHSRLNAGQKVAIHCLGGLGRSGTVAGCLLTDNGLSAHEAIELVRLYRQGAIQTAAQEDFIYEYARRNEGE